MTRYSEEKPKRYRRRGVPTSNGHSANGDHEATGSTNGHHPNVTHAHANGRTNGHSGDASTDEQVYIYARDQDDPSPMYEGLRTNLPHDLMSYRGFPFPAETPLFPNQRKLCSNHLSVMI